MAILNVGSAHMAEPRFKFALLIYWYFLADVLASFAWASFSVTTYAVLQAIWTVSELSYVFFLMPSGLALKSWLRTRVFRRAPSRESLPERVFEASICVFALCFSSVMSSAFFLIAAPLMRFHPDNDWIFPFALLSSEVYSQAMIFAAVNIPIQLFAFFATRALLLRKFASQIDVSAVDPLRTGPRVYARYFLLTVCVSAVAIQTTALFWSKLGNCIYFIYEDPVKAFAAH